jgi:hypothetical protein
MFKLIAVLAAATSLLAVAAAAQPAAAPAPAAAPPAPPGPNDYAAPAAWLCWPGRADACAVDLTTTVVAADGSTTTETFKADPKAPVDCFYVYPTVSRDPGAVSDMIAGPEERNVVRQQLARFGAKCRLYAPMYRQFTLTALGAMMAGRPMPGSIDPAIRDLGYNDVKAAWAYYLAHENHGRGVVLIGHSQGSGVLTELIKQEIDGKPAQAQLLSAMLLGTSLMIPKGADVGGDFKSIPLCHSASQLGCVIAYASFRETSPPPASSFFGRPRGAPAGMIAACVNPANLGGGSGALHSYMPAGNGIVADPSALRPWAKGLTVTTPFVSVPGLLSAQCVDNGAFNYLAIHINADPADPRTDDIAGDIVVGGVVLKDWGFHLIDANLAMGNLVDIVGEESKVWAAKHH